MKRVRGLTRRDFLRCGAAAGAWAGLEALLPTWARASGGVSPVGSDVTELAIREVSFQVGGRRTVATTINGSVPGPLVRLREGQEAVIRVANELDEDTSIHWHGILLPAGMDGVPGVSFAGIPPGETFTYRFPVKQSGTYWYHSHSGLQEQLGHYGPLILDPAEPEPYRYDREHVVMLADWTFENPYRVLAKLKKQSDYYNFQKQTVADLVRDASARGWGAALAGRREWAAMRMDPTDLADVTGATYTYLVNGLAPGDNWTGLFRPGERVRLRFINAASMTIFDVRIPGLPLTVVQADGQDVEPVTVDEFRIGVAETYDVIVQPGEDRAYTVFAEALDRSGYGRGTLAPRPGLEGPIPARRRRPVRTMADMGMAGHGAHGGAVGHAAAPGAVPHGPDHHGPGNAMVAEVPANRLGEPGTGLEDAGHRVLVYADLWALVRPTARRPGDRAPPHRQHGALCLGLRREEVLRSRADPLRARRAPAAHPGQRHHDGAPHPPARDVDGARQRRRAVEAEEAHGPRQARGTALGGDHGRRPWRLGLPLPPPLPHGARDVPGGLGGAGRRGAVMRRLTTVVLTLAAVRGGASRAAGGGPGWAPGLHAHQVFWFLLLDQLEYREAEGRDALAWDVLGWVGGDYDRLWLKAEGDQELGGHGRGKLEAQALYGRMVSPFWDLQAGVRHDRFYGEGPDRFRSFAVLGVQGLAPYWFELEPALFLSGDGDLSFRLTAEYDLLLTQRLVLQPKLELDASLQEVEEFGVGRGFNELEVGFRLRYEIRRELAPYVGVTWKRELGATAGLAREDGEDVEAFSVVAGVRLWL